MWVQAVIGRHPPLHCFSAAQSLSLFAAENKRPQSRIAQKFTAVEILSSSLMFITPYSFKKVKNMSIWLQVTRDIATFLMSDFRSGLVCLKDINILLYLMLC